MENKNHPSQASPEVETTARAESATAEAAPSGQAVESQKMTAEQKRMLAFAIVGVILIVAVIVAAVWGLLAAQPETTAQIRDVFLIFMALESIFIGLALVILMVQLARLINLLQNEIKPILDSTNETVSHLRGTTVFLSDNLVGPVIKLNEYLAGFGQFLQVIGLVRKSSKPRQPPKGE